MGEDEEQLVQKRKNSSPVKQPNVTLHLRNATSSMTRDLGWGKGYSSDLRKV